MNSARGCMRVHPADMEKDEKYLKKIKKLVMAKMKLFADHQVLLEEEEIEKKKMKEMASIPSLKEFITNEMNGKDMTLVIKKILYASDLLRSQNRLSMPMNQLETHEFLTENERKDLDNGKEFEVELLGPRLRVHGKPMVMKMWRLTTSNSYVLKTNWNEFVKENDDVLKEKTKIQVWSFRIEEKLYFALACV